MPFTRLASLFGVAILVMALNVAFTFLYMIIYGHLLNPGHPEDFYRTHVQSAAPYCSIVAGVPLLFVAGYWVSGWSQSPSGVTAALILWAIYAVIDLAVLIAAGLTPKIALLFSISFLTKLAAAYAGAHAAGSASR